VSDSSNAKYNDNEPIETETERGIFIFRDTNGDPRRLIVISPSDGMDGNLLFVDDSPPFYVEIPDNILAKFKSMMSA